MARAKEREEGILRQDNHAHIQEEVEEEGEESSIHLKGQGQVNDDEEDEQIESAPATPSNKENSTKATPIILPDEDEEMEVYEQNDEVRPLTTENGPLARTLAVGTAQSASPVSRKSRLSALAQSINSWEDDLGTPSSRQVSTTPQPHSPKPTTARFSVSTPPGNRLAAQGNQKRVSCHQFIATAAVPQQRSRSVSPTKKLTPSASVSSPFERSPAKVSTPLTKEVSFASSPQKDSPAPPPMIESPQKFPSPIRQKARSVSPVKQMHGIQTPQPVKEDKLERNLVS